MKPKHKRLCWILLGLTSIAIGVALFAKVFNDSLVFFYTPAQVKEKHVPEHERIRLGGMVEKGSIRYEGSQILFTVTDFTETMRVEYTGIPPNLFKEGQGVVAEGHLQEDTFIAETLLAKHDENYMPPALKKQLPNAQLKQP